MWPMLLDIDKHECQLLLRKYELEAYSSVVTALRAQGDLNIERRKILKDLSSILSIPLERHCAEVRRAINDEKLYTIAYNVSGQSLFHEWIVEGKRLIPLLPRLEPQTLFTTLANTCANMQVSEDRSLPDPSKTRSLKLKHSTESRYHKSNRKRKFDTKNEKVYATKLKNKPISINNADGINPTESTSFKSTNEAFNEKVKTPKKVKACISKKKVIEPVISPTISKVNSASFKVDSGNKSDIKTVFPINNQSAFTSVSTSMTMTSATTSSTLYPKVILVSSNSLASIQGSTNVKKLSISPSSSIENKKIADKTMEKLKLKKDDTVQKNIEILQTGNLQSIFTSVTSASSIISTNIGKNIFTKHNGQQQYIVVPINSKSVNSVPNLKTITTVSKLSDKSNVHSNSINSQKFIYQATTSKEGQKTNFIIMKPKLPYSPANISCKNKSDLETKEETIGETANVTNDVCLEDFKNVKDCLEEVTNKALELVQQQQNADFDNQS